MYKPSLTFHNNWHTSLAPTRRYTQSVFNIKSISDRPSTGILQLILVVWLRRFGTNKLPHFQWSLFFDCPILEDRADRLTWIVGNKQPPTLRKIPEGEYLIYNMSNIRLFVTKQTASTTTTVILSCIGNLYKTWFRTQKAAGNTAVYNYWRRDRYQNTDSKNKVLCVKGKLDLRTGHEGPEGGADV